MNEMITVTCPRIVCWNGGSPIEIPASTFMDGVEYPTELVYCGSCGHQIPVPGVD